MARVSAYASSACSEPDSVVELTHRDQQRGLLLAESMGLGERCADVTVRTTKLCL